MALVNLLVVLILVLAITLLFWRTRVGTRIQLALRRRSRRPHTGRTITVIQGDEEIEAPSPAPARERPLLAMLRERARPSGRNLALLGLTILILLLVWRLPGLFSSHTDHFVVLVAPFRDTGGTVGQTGRVVASQLVAQLPDATSNRVVAQLIDEAPAANNPDAALALLTQYHADAMVWGEVSPGGMLNQESLRPMLAYQPAGLYAPDSWDGYLGRFAMPSLFRLSATPINGQVVLPQLLGALADYSAGRFDAASTTLDQLITDTPALDTTLADVMRGNLLWARGEYSQAADAYRHTGVMTAPASGASQMALVANNLGAILQDAGDPAAVPTLQRASQLLGKSDLLELRVNWGIQQLRSGQPQAALATLQQALALVPASATPPGTLQLALAEAERQNGQPAQASQTLDQLDHAVEAESNLTTADLRPLVSSRIHAAVLEQRALLQLAQLFDSTRPLLWEIEADRQPPIDQLAAASHSMDDAIAQTTTLDQSWQRLSAAQDAANSRISGLIATGQSRRTQAALRDRQRWRAAIMIELTRSEGTRQPQGLAALWAALTGDSTPLGQARSTLTQLRQSNPGDIDSAILLGHALLLDSRPTDARAQFSQAAQIDAHRPEPVYGSALVALTSDSGRARQLLQQAIDLDATYFPAREKLAQLAEDGHDWADALTQRRWLAKNQPGDETTLALAHTLRLSGSSGYVEAEQLLLPLGNANNVAALLELNQLYQASNNPRAGSAVLARAEQIDPNNAEVAYQYGNVLLAQNDAVGAQAQFQRALAARPDDIDAHLALGRLYSARGQSDAATREFRAALDLGARDLLSLKQIGLALLSAGQYDAAATAYERAQVLDSQDAEVHHGLGQAYLHRSQLDAARSEEQHALQLRGGTYPAALVGLGDIALQQNNPTLAASQYQAALKQSPDLGDAYLGLGRAAASQGNWAVAQDYYQHAVLSMPDSPEAHRRLADAMLQQNNPALARQALGEYQRAASLQPSDAQAYFGLAQAQASLGQLDQAQASLGQALQLRPGYAEALLLQGKLYEQQGQVPAAIDAYSRSIGANGQIAEVHYRRALLYIRGSRINEAMSDLDAAVNIQPNFPEAHYWLGRGYLIEGRPADALTQFQRAVDQRGGSYPEARFYQGLAEQQLGHRDAAAASFRAALQQDQHSLWAPEAQAALAQLGP